MADGDWDLFAVVRGSKSATSTTIGLGPSNNTTINTTTRQNYLVCLSNSNSSTFDEGDAVSGVSVAPFTFPSFVQPVTSDFHELQQACIPFMGGTTKSNNTTSAIGVDMISVVHNPKCAFLPDFGESTARKQQHPQQQAFQFGGPHLQNRIFHSQQQPPSEPHKFQLAQSTITSCVIPSQQARSRKRKSHQKRLVCHIPADKVSSDLWAWRKYGQKPIKGSPYPRNYYRCSSSKGCAARKQVERSTKDSELFVVTYTGDHTHPRPTHRNSSAGSTRSRLSSTPLETRIAINPLTRVQHSLE